MTKIKLGIISIGIIFLFLACNNTSNQTNTNTSQSTATPTPAAAKPTPDTLAATRELYMQQCVDCHKEDGSGGETIVGKKKIKAASLKSGRALTHSDEELINIISNGEEAMPDFKNDLTAEQIKSLVQFIRKEFQGQ